MSDEPMIMHKVEGLEEQPQFYEPHPPSEYGLEQIEAALKSVSDMLEEKVDAVFISGHKQGVDDVFRDIHPSIYFTTKGIRIDVLTNWEAGPHTFEIPFAELPGPSTPEDDGWAQEYCDDRNNEVIRHLLSYIERLKAKP